MYFLTKLRLRTRIGLLFGLVLLLLTAFMAWTGAQGMNTAIQMTLQERLALVRTVALHLDQELEQTLERLAEVAALPTVSLEDDLELEKTELQRLYRPERFDYVFILDKDGLVLWTEPYLPEVVGIKRLECPHVQEALLTGQPACACVAHALTPEKPVVAPVVPIKNEEGTIMGVLGVAIDPSSPTFAHILQGVAPGRTGYVQLVDENGIVLAHTEGRRLFQKSEHADLFISLLREKQAAVTTETVSEEGRGTFREVIAFAPLTVAPWGVAVEQEEAELLAPALELRNRAILFAVGALAAALLLVWVTTRSVVEPVRQLVAASQRIAAGDLATPVPPLGEDEIGELGRRFEEMREHIARWGEELEAKVKERTEALQASHRFLEIANRHTEMIPLLKEFVAEVRNLTGCAAVGIRLLDEEGNIPYQAYEGFSQEFYDKESPLSIKSDQCMCINVIKGTADPKLPFYTEGGSFYMNATTRFLATVSEEEKGATRSECNRAGYESVALAPIRLGERILGLIHVADPREDMVPLETVGILERVVMQLGEAIQRLRVEEEIKRRTRELSILYTIDRAVAQSLELEEVLNDAVTATLEALQIEVGGIYLLEPDGETMILRVHRGASEEFVEAVQRIRLGEGISGQAAAEGKPVVLDVPDYPTERLAPFVLKEGFQTLASAPLLSKGQALGALTLGTRRPRAFPPQELDLLAAIGRDLGGIVENARLYERERRLVTYLHHLNQATTRASANVQLDALAQVVVESLVEKFGVAFARLWVVDEAGENLVLRASAGLYTRLDGSRARVPIATDPRKLGVIARERRSLITNTVPQDPHFDRAWAERKGLVAFAGYPVILGDHLLGILALFSRQPLDEEILDVLGAFVNQVAVALSNAQLFVERQQKIAELAALNQVGRALVTTLHLDELLEIIYQAVTTVMEADAFFIALYDREANELDFRIRVDKGVREPPERRPPAGLSALIVSSGEPLLIRDFEREQDQYPQVKLWGTMEASASWLGVPMKVGELVVGVISVQAYRPEAYDEGHQALLSTIAAQAGMAVQNARLFEETRQHLAELEARQRVMAATLQTLDLDECLSIAVAETMQLVEAEMGGIYLVERDRLILRVHRGLPDDLLASVRDLPLAETTWASETTVRRERLSEQGGQMDEAYKRAGVQGWVATPLKVEDRLVGVFWLASHRYEAFSDAAVGALRALADQVAVAVENARLYTQAQQRLARLTTLREIDRAIAAQLSLEDVIGVVLEQVHPHIVGVDAVGFSLIDWEAKRTLLAFLHLPDGAYIEGEAFELSESLLEWLAVRREPVLIYDLLADPRVQNHRQVIRQHGLKSYLAVPLVVRDQAIGVLHVLTTHPRRFRDEEVDFFATMAGQAAISIQNARLYRDMGRRLAELSDLFEVSSALRGAATAEDMLPIILGKTVEAVNADTGAFFRVDERTEELVAQAAQGRLENLLRLRLDLTEGVCGYVAQTCAPYSFADLAADPYTGTRIQPLVEGVQGGVCVPLMVGNLLVGTLIIGSYTPRTFTDDEIRLLTAIADMAASAIHRASLFEQLQARVRELTTVYDVGKTIITTLRIGDVLDFVVGAACETLHAEASYLFLWDEQEDRLVMRAVHELSPELVGQLKYRLGEGLSGWVFLEGKLANVPDVAADPRWKREPNRGELPSGRAISALVVPLMVGTKALGVLGVINKVGAPAFTESDQSLLAALAGQMAIAVENARLYEDVRGLSIATIRSLATAIDARDPYTKGHSDQVARLSVLLAQEMGWNRADLEMLEFAALLHDVGKIGIPDAILRKVESLSPDEWNHIRLHPYHSAQIVKPVQPLQRIIPWIYHHQEKWDGTGYPDGLKGKDIPLAARIIAVADAFNAMTTDRPYRKAKTREEAIEELRRCAGAQFDPQVVEVFVGLLEEEVDITGGGERKPFSGAKPVVEIARP